MAEALRYEEVARMVQAAADSIGAHHEELSRLDSAIGDGDHGVSMNRAMQSAAKAVAADGGDSIESLLSDVGWAVMGIDGGSTGPLVGSLFMGMSEGVGGAAELDLAGVAAMFAAGLANVRAQTKAQVGDKTMIDAMVPAVTALQEAPAGTGLAEAMRRAAAAACAGAEATKDMQARFGRARNMGERTIGYIDPGARSIAYVFAAFADALTDV